MVEYANTDEKAKKHLQDNIRRLVYDTNEETLTNNIKLLIKNNYNLNLYEIFDYSLLETYVGLCNVKLDILKLILDNCHFKNDEPYLYTLNNNKISDSEKTKIFSLMLKYKCTNYVKQEDIFDKILKYEKLKLIYIFNISEAALTNIKCSKKKELIEKYKKIVDMGYSEKILKMCDVYSQTIIDEYVERILNDTDAVGYLKNVTIEAVKDLFM